MIIKLGLALVVLKTHKVASTASIDSPMYIYIYKKETKMSLEKI